MGTGQRDSSRGLAFPPPWPLHPSLRLHRPQGTPPVRWHRSSHLQLSTRPHALPDGFQGCPPGHSGPQGPRAGAALPWDAAAQTSFHAVFTGLTTACLTLLSWMEQEGAMRVLDRAVPWAGVRVFLWGAGGVIGEGNQASRQVTELVTTAHKGGADAQ